ncbi:Hypothetical protein, putative [Bodo saltans]|uniref:C3H1-type domain-containing protein n=1 Tax=Bodo saltans TaxID=75058 RepID=A0A0S4JNL5_BODSA|nr:Hypothetical protein, putative [Bodo saltans]|eukprot:CUG91809.1 Hypothetical protein, putative [Bodo saltans]
MSTQSQQPLHLVEIHDDEDICKFATDAFLASVVDSPATSSKLTDDANMSLSPQQGERTPQPSSPATNKNAVSSFTEQLGVFAKSLTGVPSPAMDALFGTLSGQTSAIISLDEVVRLRSSEAAKRVQECAQRKLAAAKARQQQQQQDASSSSAAQAASIPNDPCEGDADEQLNDERVQQSLVTNSQVTEVFDPTFRFCFEVPTQSLVHLPPARLNITRLVFCRNYAPGDHQSCSMGDGCKFVHADVDFRTLEAHPIHVKYSWRHEDVCTYARLPAGEVLRVSAPNNRPPVEEINSDRVLVTRGSLRRQEGGGTLSHCAHYYFNRMCNRGERCNFIHVVHVDPNVVGDFKRAPCCKPKSSSSHGNNNEDKAEWTADGKWVQNDRRHLAGGQSSSFRPNSDAKPFEPKMKLSVDASDLVAFNGFAPPPPFATAPANMMTLQSLFGGVAVAAPSTIAVQMPQREAPQTAQYGMLVFVPCDQKQSPITVSPAVLNPPTAQSGGLPSIHSLPTTTLDLMNAAYPGLTERWTVAGADPASLAEAIMRPEGSVPSAQQQQAAVAQQVAQQVAQAQQMQQQAGWYQQVAQNVSAGEWVVGVPQTVIHQGVEYMQQPFHTMGDYRRMPRTRGGGGGGHSSLR